MLAGAVMVAVSEPNAVAAVPPCGADVAIAFDRAGPPTAGESQSGALLVLRNLGSAACSIPGLPKLLFEDAAGHALAVLRKTPPGMHPGPVVMPIVLAPGAEASAALHWMSREGDGDHHCATPYELEIGEGPDAPGVPWRFGQLCGEPGRPISFSQALMRARPRP